MLKWVGIGFGIILLALIALIVGLALAPVEIRQAFRDIFIVLLGLFTLVGVILMIAVLLGLFYILNRIDRLARGTLVPKVDESIVKLNEVLDSTRTLANNVRDSSATVTGSTTFVAERVVSPVIRIASLATGVRAAATTLARRGAPESIAEQMASQQNGDLNGTKGG
ncbi:hypothetical protein [Candidatus Chloroploca sp. Khr17]|uniref:hypothetical protein n=1 Tax=Candidatus Chloroploca sp. Khr17 TaxID=2496869 RepID=UPI00101DF39B|nr:hypothetical protein [Candidatus Chloroploca sp. Khr17]